MSEGDRVLVRSDSGDGWANTISLLRVSSGQAALGRVTGQSIDAMTQWFCADTEKATTMPAFDSQNVVVGCMSGECSVELMIGTQNVGACFDYTATELVSASLHFYRGDNNQCHYDSLCAKPNPNSPNFLVNVPTLPTSSILCCSKPPSYLQ